MKIIIYSLLYAIANVAASTIIKHKLLTYSLSGLKSFIYLFFSPVVMLSILLVVISMYFSMRALTLSAFTTVIPITTAFNFFLTILSGIFIFSDKINKFGFMGFVFILLGVYFVLRGYGGAL